VKAAMISKSWIHGWKIRPYRQDRQRLRHYYRVSDAFVSINPRIHRASVCPPCQGAAGILAARRFYYGSITLDGYTCAHKSERYLFPPDLSVCRVVQGGHGKSWNLATPFSRPGKSWKIAKVIQSHGKVMENDDDVMEFLLLH